MPFSDGASSLLFAQASAASRFAGTLLVGALLMRFSGPGAVRLRFWGVAWIGLALQVAGSTVASAAGGEDALLFFFGATALSVGTYGYLFGLIIGASELPEQRPLTPLSRQSLLAAATILAALTLTSFYVAPLAPIAASAFRHQVPLLSRAVSCAAVAYRLGRDRPRFGTGRFLVFFSLMLQGAQAVVHLVLSVSRSEASLPSGLSNVVIVGLMGIGMIACLLDDDHQELARASAEARRASALDALTGLSNKASFVQEADSRLSLHSAQGPGFGVVFLALNRLGGINHSLGHATGDRILRASGERLRASLRDGDQVARVGGDEFAVLVGSVSQRDDVVAVAHKLEEVMRRPFDVDARELSVTASVGVSVYPDDASDAATLLDQACTAAYRVKDRVGGSVGVYSKGMNADALQRLSLEHDLRRAIERDELVLYFQPIFHLPGATVRGFEALLRWRHPRYGLIGAELIVSIAEATGLIHSIGPWALRTACAKVEALRRAGRESLLLSANVSAHQLMSPDLAEQVERALRESGLPASNLEIEITETAAIDNVQIAREHLLRIKQKGVSIAIDDFGTGYSSLAYLRNLPLDTIKIDRSFIRDVGLDLGDGALVTTIIALAQGRDLRVVAEGVETDEQLRFLVSRGCDYAQGYFLSRPLAPEELDEGGSFSLREAQESWTDD